MYKSVVIPSVVYGCEVWNDLKNKDLFLLNRPQHFVAEHAQKFSTLTRSDICESMVGLRSIICELEKRKLFFFWKLCKMDYGYLVKNIFMHRLFTCMSDTRHRIGSVPEILNILSKYNLFDFLTYYTKNADFPEKRHWKRIVVDAVNQKHDFDWQTRIKCIKIRKSTKMSKICFFQCVT
jgi:hypothetical protein